MLLVLCTDLLILYSGHYSATWISLVVHRLPVWRPPVSYFR